MQINGSFSETRDLLVVFIAFCRKKQPCGVILFVPITAQRVAPDVERVESIKVQKWLDLGASSLCVRVRLGVPCPRVARPCVRSCVGHCPLE